MTVVAQTDLLKELYSPVKKEYNRIYLARLLEDPDPDRTRASDTDADSHRQRAILKCGPGQDKNFGHRCGPGQDKNFGHRCGHARTGQELRKRRFRVLKSFFTVSLKDVAISDCRVGFYIESCPYSHLEAPRLVQISQTQFPNKLCFYPYKVLYSPLKGSIKDLIGFLHVFC